MWGNYRYYDYKWIDLGYSYEKFYEKELYPTYENPGNRTKETHNFILQLNDKKYKNVKFVKKENKKVMSQQEILDLKNRKKMKKIIKQSNKEVMSYFDFAN